MSEGPCCTCPQPQCLRAGERPAYFQSQEETNTLKQMRRVALHREPRSLAICKHEACPLPREGGCSPRSVHSRSARATAKGWRGRQRGPGDSGLCSGDTRGQATGGGAAPTPAESRTPRPWPSVRAAACRLFLTHSLNNGSSRVTSNAPPWAGELRLPFRIPQPHRDPHLSAGPKAASLFTCLLPDLSGAPRTLP